MLPADRNDPIRNRAKELFLDMVELGNTSLLDAEPDSEVRRLALELWERHLRADREGFLVHSPTLVRQLHDQPTPALQSGRRLANRFVIVERLGAGGMGEVYLALDERLQERVALKTIRPELLDLQPVRLRFLAEVHNARKVTHPNVCRIYDLFEEESASFFVMELLPGPTLAQSLSGPPLEPSLAKHVALQLAQGLDAAHRCGIIHRDFKPANVILVPTGDSTRAVITDFGLARALDQSDSQNLHSLQAGTLDYMAPELLSGAPATVRSDIFAYGKVLAHLLPKHPLLPRLVATDPTLRLDSLDPVIQSLSAGQSTRRNLLLGITGLAAAAGVTYWQSRKPHLPFGGTQRVIINGFRASAGAATRVSSLRNLLVLALGQSPLFRILTDLRLQVVLRQLRLPYTLPADLPSLHRVADNEKAALIIDGELRPKAAGLELTLSLFRPGASQPAFLFAQQIDDPRQLTRLAEAAALRLRHEVGESPGAIRNAYSPLEQVTSASPEAVEAYFEAVQRYEKSDAEGALLVLDRALSLDPDFVLAHHYKGLALSARARTRSALDSSSKAFSLRHRLQSRERTWIESHYYNVTGDYVSALEAYKRNASLYPDDAIFQRQAAFGYAQLGQFDEALRAIRRAVALDPFSDNNKSELINNLSEAMHYQEALQGFDDYRRQGDATTILNWGAGLACLGLRDYPRATAIFDEMRLTPTRERQAHLWATMPKILQGDLYGACLDLQADLAYDEITGEEYRQLKRREWAGWSFFYRDQFPASITYARQLASITPVPNYISALRAGGLLASANRDESAYSAAVAGLEQLLPLYSSTRLSGILEHVRAAWNLATGNLSAAQASSVRAIGLWPDVLSLRTAAQVFLAVDQPDRALALLRQAEPMQGRILKHEWPGWLVILWFELGSCLKRLNRNVEAAPYLDLARRHWAKPLAGTSIATRILSVTAHPKDKL